MNPVMFSSILIVVGGLVAAIFILRFSGGGAERDRLKTLKARPSGASGVLESGGDAGILLEDEGLVSRVFATLAASFQRQQSDEPSKTGLRLLQAGFRSKEVERIFLGVRIATVVLFPAVYALVSRQLLDATQYDLIAFPMSAALGWVAPSFFLDKKIQKRHREIDSNLSSAIDLLAVSVEAGLGLIPALARIGSEMKRISPVLSEELEMVRMETSTGKSSSDALMGLGTRVGTREMKLFVNMLSQTERFGTSVTDALREYSDEIRVRRTLLAEERAASAALRMLFPTAMIMMSVVILILALAGLQAQKVGL